MLITKELSRLKNAGKRNTIAWLELKAQQAEEIAAIKDLQEQDEEAEEDVRAAGVRVPPDAAGLRGQPAREPHPRSRPQAGRWETAPSPADGVQVRPGQRPGRRPHLGAGRHRGGHPAASAAGAEEHPARRAHPEGRFERFQQSAVMDGIGGGGAGDTR